MDASDLYGDDFDVGLSSLLDEAISQEEYHRDELTKWREIRRQLESQVVTTADQVLSECAEIAEVAWHDHHS